LFDFVVFLSLHLRFCPRNLPDIAVLFCGIQTFLIVPIGAVAVSNYDGIDGGFGLNAESS